MTARHGPGQEIGVSWLAWVFLESPAALGVAVGTALFVLLVHWRRSGRPRALVIGLLVAGALFLIQGLVETRREAGLRLLTVIEEAVRRGDAGPVSATLAPTFEAGGRDRAAFVAYVNRWLGRVRVRMLERSWPPPRVEESAGDRFVLSVRYVADLAGEYAGTLPSAWRLTFVRTAGGWRLEGVEATYIAGLRDVSWPAIDRQ